MLARCSSTRKPIRQLVCTSIFSTQGRRGGVVGCQTSNVPYYSTKQLRRPVLPTPLTNGLGRRPVAFRRSGEAGSHSSNPDSGKNLPIDVASHAYVRVSAFHIAQTIDLHKATQTCMASLDNIEQANTKNTAIFKLTGPQQQQNGTTASNTNPKFFAIYPYGSLVFFNMSESETDSLIHQIQSSAAPPLFNRRESFGVVVTKDLPTSSRSTSSTVASPDQQQQPHATSPVTGDYCTVPELEWNGVVVIGNILAQSVALDSYADTVDGLLTNFAQINSSVATTGNLTDQTLSLFKTVAQNNAIFIEMISKIRILDRSDTAWNLVKYERIHYGLKEEFEIDDRFENIEFKLNLIEKNAKFFLEVLHHQKSSKLEWIIVILILLECVLMVVEMSGTGTPIFQAWGRGELWPDTFESAASAHTAPLINDTTTTTTNSAATKGP